MSSIDLKCMKFVSLHVDQILKGIREAFWIIIIVKIQNLIMEYSLLLTKMQLLE